MLVIEDVEVRENAGSVVVTIRNVGRVNTNLNFNVMTQDYSGTGLEATGQWMLLSRLLTSLHAVV